MQVTLPAVGAGTPLNGMSVTQSPGISDLKGDCKVQAVLKQLNGWAPQHQVQEAEARCLSGTLDRGITNRKRHTDLLFWRLIRWRSESDQLDGPLLPLYGRCEWGGERPTVLWVIFCSERGVRFPLSRKATLLKGDIWVWGCSEHSLPHPALGDINPVGFH